MPPRVIKKASTQGDRYPHECEAGMDSRVRHGNDWGKNTGMTGKKGGAHTVHDQLKTAHVF